MIISESKTRSTTEGMRETTEFSMNLDGMMFDNLMNGIYADKIAAPIRELSTNARDGHARRGNLQRPFDIRLPTKLDQEFSVRDYGSSLTHEDVMEMYTVLGQSTKRETNDETGCLGLGSKSPFAYTSAFTVTCWLDGLERTYSAYITTSGIPNMSLVHSEPSDEEQGVRVTFAVKDDDIQKFHKSAETVLLGFEPTPNISPKSFQLASREITLSGTGWKFCKDEMKAVIVQGSVSYPIDREDTSLQQAVREAFKRSDGNHYSWQRDNNIGNYVLQNSSILNVPIGSLDVVTSRESLQYTDKTIQSIVRILKTVDKEINKLVQDKLDEAGNYRKACELLSEMKSDKSPIGQILICRSKKDQEFTYKDKEISQAVPLFEYDTMIMEKGWQDNSEKKLKASYRRDLVNSKEYRDHQSISWKNLQTQSSNYYYGRYTIVVQSKEQDYSLNMRMRAFWEKSEHKSGYIWIITDTDKEAEAIQTDNYLEDNEIYFLHKLTDKKMPKRDTIKSDGTPSEISLRTVGALERNYYYKNPVNSEVVDTDQEFIYVRQEGQTFFLDKTSDDLYNEEELMRLIGKIKETLPDFTTVFTVPKSRKKLMDKPKAVSLQTYMKSKLTKKFIQKELRDISVSMTTHQNRLIRDYLIGTDVHLPQIMQSFCDVIDTDVVSSEDVKKREALRDNINTFTEELRETFDKIVSDKFSKAKVVEITTPLLDAIAAQFRWGQMRNSSVDALNEYIKLKGYK